MPGGELSTLSTPCKKGPWHAPKAANDQRCGQAYLATQELEGVKRAQTLFERYMWCFVNKMKPATRQEQVSIELRPTSIARLKYKMRVNVCVATFLALARTLPGSAGAT